MEPLLADDAAIVTGATNRIGLSIPQRFATYGADVICADIVEEPRGGGWPMDEVIEETTDLQAVFVECNIRGVSDLETVVSRLQRSSVGWIAW